LRIATNHRHDVYRRYKKYQVFSIENQELAQERLLPLYDFFSSPSIFPVAKVEKHELEPTVQEALNQLGEDQRIVVVWVDLQELDYRETANIRGIPIGTVKSRLARACTRLQQPLSYSITNNRPLDSRSGFL
jgi:RNA polymerase sigma factor (sigma-70 family)